MSLSGGESADEGGAAGSVAVTLGGNDMDEVSAPALAASSAAVSGTADALTGTVTDVPVTACVSSTKVILDFPPNLGAGRLVAAGELWNVGPAYAMAAATFLFGVLGDLDSTRGLALFFRRSGVDAAPVARPLPSPNVSTSRESAA